LERSPEKLPPQGLSGWSDDLLGYIDLNSEPRQGQPPKAKKFDLLDEDFLGVEESPTKPDPKVDPPINDESQLKDLESRCA
jgi:hypothetical protein